MKEKAAMPWEQQASSSNHSTEDFKSLDSDALKLTSMGYRPALRRNYSVLSVLAVGFSLTNSWFGISAALITGTSIACIFRCPALCMPSLGSLHTCEPLSNPLGVSEKHSTSIQRQTSIREHSLLTTA